MTEHVKIDDTSPEVRYTVGATPQTVFTIPFTFFTASDIEVYVDGVLKTLTTDYSVSGTSGFEKGFPGGTVTFGAAISNASVQIVRNVPIERTTDFPNSGPLQIPSLNTQLDKFVAMLQQMDAKFARTILLGINSAFSGLTLPDPEAGKFLKWKADNSGLENTAEVTFAPNNYPVATQSEAEAGNLNSVLMTPKRTDDLLAARRLPPQYDSEADLEASTVPTSADFVTTLGMDTRGNEVPAVWKETSSAPSHGAYKTDQAGRIFEIWIKYTPPNIMQFGGSVYSADDNTPALLKMLAYCKAKNLKWCQVPGTTLTFKTWPGELGQYGDIYLEGAGRDKTFLRRDYNEATQLRGFFHYNKGRPKFSGMTFVPAVGAAGGNALSIVATADGQADVVTIDDVRITSGTPNGWYVGLNIDGSLKTTPAIGARNTQISGLEIFGCELATARLISTHLLSWHGGSSIRDTGSGTASGDIIVGGVSGVPADLIDMSLTTIAGDLVLLDYVAASQFKIGYVGGQILNTVNDTDVLTIGRVEGGVQRNWIDSQHIETRRDNGSGSGWTWRDLGNGEYEIWSTQALTTSPQTFTFPAAFGSFGVAERPICAPLEAVACAVNTLGTNQVTAVAAASCNCIVGARGRR